MHFVVPVLEPKYDWLNAQKEMLPDKNITGHEPAPLPYHLGLIFLVTYTLRQSGGIQGCKSTILWGT